MFICNLTVKCISWFSTGRYIYLVVNNFMATLSPTTSTFEVAKLCIPCPSSVPAEKLSINSGQLLLPDARGRSKQRRIGVTSCGEAQKTAEGLPGSLMARAFDSKPFLASSRPGNVKEIVIRKTHLTDYFM